MNWLTQAQRSASADSAIAIRPKRKKKTDSLTITSQ